MYEDLRAAIELLEEYCLNHECIGCPIYKIVCQCARYVTPSSYNLDRLIRMLRRSTKMKVKITYLIHDALLGKVKKVAKIEGNADYILSNIQGLQEYEDAYVISVKEINENE